jgi:hypothetical protein
LPGIAQQVEIGLLRLEVSQVVNGIKMALPDFVG